ncbi:MAG: hypothetical protein AAB588_01770 [Patescibacteria group bacterium]
MSLIIAMLFATAFMLLLAGMAQSQLAVIRNIANRENADKTRALIESVEELASYAASKHFSGWNSTAESVAELEQEAWESAREMGYTSCDTTNAANGTKPCAGFSVQGRGDAGTRINFNGTQYYSVPTPDYDGSKLIGTGSAAKADSQGLSACDPATYKDGTQANDPCFWDRLNVGQTVEIPLYYEDASGVVQNINLATSTFKLRVRTPCDNAGYEEVAGCRRVELFPRVSTTTDSYRNVKKDKVLIQWMITGEDKTLLASDAETGGVRDDRLFKNNTELSAGRINDAMSPNDGRYLSDFLVLQEDHKGTQLAGSEKEEPLIKAFNSPNSTLRLSLVGQPRRNVYDSTQYNPERHANDRAFDIPYLEYQLLVICNTSGCAPSDSKAILSGWVQIGGFSKSFVKYRRKEPSFGGFVFENF